MAEIKKNVLTQEGLKRYEEELQDLRVNKRKEIADKIKEAREQGDLSENAEYDAAKDEQRDIEARIGELEELLKHAEVYVSEETPIDRVGIGSLVKVLDIEEDEELEFKIVGSQEADSLSGKISNESPVGAKLLGKEAGEVVTVELPAGNLSYKIIGITKENSDE
jgi:transcription elongation factor greA|nr:transcription elongation factor GreA [uncultured Stomatobaculum sp.]